MGEKKLQDIENPIEQILAVFEKIRAKEQEVNFEKAQKILSDSSSSIKDEVWALNQFGLYTQPITEEDLRRHKAKNFMTRIYEHSEEDLLKMMGRYMAESQAMGGPIKHHSEVPEKKGWLLPFLFAYDQLFWGRWDYWAEIIEKGTIEGSGPIPQIQWCEDPNMRHQVEKMLNTCLDLTYYEGARIYEFAEWLLWGLGATNEPPKISAKTNEHWYKNFDLALLQKYPHDYMSKLLEEAASKGYQDALGYFSTPRTITTLMTDMLFSFVDPEEAKGKSIYDGCVGCGAMILPASNYTLFAYAQDISPIAVKLCIIQMFIYAPWYAINPLKPST